MQGNLTNTPTNIYGVQNKVTELIGSMMRDATDNL